MDYNPNFKIANMPGIACQLLSTVSVCTGQVVCGFYFPTWSVILAYLQEVSNYPTEKVVIVQESIIHVMEKRFKE